jgi:ribulose 1,5-bisphosphate carboxylase large subunit-like protein
MRSPIDDRERKRLFTGREELGADEHIFVRYRLTPATGLSLDEAAARNLIVTSLRTMRQLTHESAQARLQSAGRVVSVDASGYVEIAYPLEQCSQREGLTHLLLLMSTAAEYNYTETFWIEAIEVPRSLVERHQGPRSGVDGIREMFAVESRPIIGLVVKPRRGVSLDVILRTCEEALRGGVDFLVDDLLLVDPDGELRFESRVPRLVELAQRITRDSGESKFYFANVALSPTKAASYTQVAIDAGAGGVLVNAFTMGVGGVEAVADAAEGRALIVSTNMGSGLMSRGSLLGSASVHPTGMSEAVVAKLSRLAGADAVHTGTSASECYGEDAWGPASRSLSQKLYAIKPAMPVAEGDLNVANLWDNIRSLGADLLLEATSGIINFPGGPGRGAEAFRLMVETVRPDMSSEEAHERIQGLMKRNRHVREGLKIFEYSAPERGRK